MPSERKRSEGKTDSSHKESEMRKYARMSPSAMEGLDLLDASDTESESDRDEQADARLARRARREKMREEAAAAATESVLDTTADSVAECAKKLEKVSTSDTAKVAETTVAGTSRPNLIITVSNEDAGKKIPTLIKKITLPERTIMVLRQYTTKSGRTRVVPRLRPGRGKRTHVVLTQNFSPERRTILVPPGQAV